MARLKIFDATLGQWVFAGGGDTEPFVGPEPPLTVHDGKLWWDTDDDSFLPSTVSPEDLAVDPAFTSRYAPVPTAWTAVTFINSWVNHDVVGSPNARYRKIGDQVYIEGRIKSGTLNQPAFSLPVGFRPPFATRFAVISANAFGNLLVSTTGEVYPSVGSSTDFFVNCDFSVLA